MTRPPTDKPLAKAEAHLQAGRFAQAAGAFRAVLLIDPAEVRAHFGLAECALARDCRDEAVTGLVAAATELGASGQIEPALHLHAGALTIDPSRLELHVEVAELELASGRQRWAAARLHALARAYRTAGRADDAVAIEEFVASFPDEPAPADEGCIVELPAPAESNPPANARRGLRRGAPRWQPVGSPGRTSKAAAPPPPPRKAIDLRPLARPLPPRPHLDRAVPPPPPQAKKTPNTAPAVVAKKKAPAAPSPLAQRLRMREANTTAPAPTTKRAKPTSREDLKRRLASTLAAVKAKHEATRSPPPDSFEDERTVLFRRPTV